MVEPIEKCLFSFLVDGDSRQDERTANKPPEDSIYTVGRGHGERMPAGGCLMMMMIKFYLGRVAASSMRRMLVRLNWSGWGSLGIVSIQRIFSC